MNKDLYDLHILAGEKAGQEATCGKKIKYSSEEKAQKAAESMNKKPTTRKELEHYPCYFCNEWHVGRKMSLEELKNFCC